MPLWQFPQFVRYWIGDVLVAWASQTVQVALYWVLAGGPHGPAQLGVLSFCSMAPVIIGGPIVVRLFQRIGIRPLMVADLVARALAYGGCSIWILEQHHEIIHTAIPFYIASAISGVSFMATTAGGPNLWPRLVPKDQLTQVMSLEQIGWNIASVGGSLTGALLINIIPLDAILIGASGLFLLGGLNLITVRLSSSRSQHPPLGPTESTRPLSMIQHDPRIWIPLVVFWFSNLAVGGVMIIEPLIIHRWRAPSDFYGVLMGLEAIAAIIGAWFLPKITRTRNLLSRILWMELIAGMLWMGITQAIHHPFLLYVGVIGAAGVSGGTSVLVQRLRFDLIEEQHRPALLTYIRTWLHIPGPVGALLAGIFLSAHSLTTLAWLLVACATIPSALFLGSPQWRLGRRISHTQEK